MNGVAEIVGGVDDHVHILASLRPVHCIADVMRDMKKDSTNWVKENFDQRFAWQEGYAGKYSFVEELKELLEKAGVAYEEKYLL